MKIKNLYYVLSLLMVLSMLLAACAPQAATATEAPAAQTEEPAVTEAPRAGYGVFRCHRPELRTVAGDGTWPKMARQ